MNVSSLFDGMSCGQIAFDKLGIKFDGVKNKYFASEIEKNAIKVTQANYPNTIQLGDVTKWREWELPEIDFLIGGSPCQGFSFAGKQLNFEDERSKLFFEFVDVLKELKPKYFMLENVKMKKSFIEIINRILNSDCIEIDSSLLSAQSRKRLYWTNIQGINQPQDKGYSLNNIQEKDGERTIKESLKKYYNNEYFTKYKSNNGICKLFDGVVQGYFSSSFSQNRIFSSNGKCPTLTTKCKDNNIFEFGGRVTPLECERLQTVPENYTRVTGISDAQRYNMLGNGWTVDVIAHILKNAVREYL